MVFWGKSALLAAALSWLFNWELVRLNKVGNGVELQTTEDLFVRGEWSLRRLDIGHAEWRQHTSRTDVARGIISFGRTAYDDSARRACVNKLEIATLFIDADNDADVSDLRLSAATSRKEDQITHDPRAAIDAVAFEILVARGAGEFAPIVSEDV